MPKKISINPIILNLTNNDRFGMWVNLIRNDLNIASNEI